MEDFSLIILCAGKGHLLPLTLDTLKSQSGSFEVLLLDPKGDNRLEEMAQKYPELKIRFQKVSGTRLGEIMNEGAGLAKGKYIQFLEPGDRYISQQGLQFLTSLIQKEPHLIYSHALNRGELAQGEFITATSPWFLKSKIFEMGGFDQKLGTGSAMDLLCRLFRDQKTHAIFCKRVFVHSEKPPSISIQETYRILYRHFGFWHALKWVFSQGRPRLIDRALTFFRQAFWRDV